jgi:hypothetical protein
MCLFNMTGGRAHARAYRLYDRIFDQSGKINHWKRAIFSALIDRRDCNGSDNVAQYKGELSLKWQS